MLSTPPTRGHIRGAHRQTLLLLTLALVSIAGLLATTFAH